MNPATWPRELDKLLWLHPRPASITHAHVPDLPSLLRPGDLLVVNDAATLPASLRVMGGDLEVRLLSNVAPGIFHAALLGPGDWRTPTEKRTPPRRVEPGEELSFAPDFSATVTRVDDRSPRLVTLRFERTEAALWEALYQHGKPIQYAHLDGELRLWHVQNIYSARPWAMELPSAGRVLTWDMVQRLTRRGVVLAALTHATGLSSIGDQALDALLPLPERYDVPAATVDTIGQIRAHGGRVVAVGTSVVRALEGNARDHGGVLTAGEGVTDVLLGPGFPIRTVDGLLSGMHEPHSSHFQLLQSFASRGVLDAAYVEAVAKGYLGHEFGDASLIL